MKYQARTHLGKAVGKNCSDFTPCDSVSQCHNLLPTINNSDCGPEIYSVYEQVCDVVPNDESSINDSVMTDDLEQHQEISFESSIDEQFRNLTMTSGSESESEINNAIENSNVIEQLRQWALIYPHSYSIRATNGHLKTPISGLTKKC